MSPETLLRPPILRPNDEVRVIVPAFSMNIISAETLANASRVFTEQLGVRISFGEHVRDVGEHNSTPLAARLDDFHNAYADSHVRAVLPVIGGWNSVDLLDRIDWQLVAANPKIFCGFSDITTLTNAIYAVTGSMTFNGPNFSTFGQRHLDQHTVDHFQQALMVSATHQLSAPATWSSDAWYIDQEKRNPRPHEGYWPIRAGSYKGPIIGGNLSSLRLLQGTDFFPTDKSCALLVEEEMKVSLPEFARNLKSLLLSLRGRHIGAVIIGKFQPESGVSRSDINELVSNSPELSDSVIIANVDCSHTDPMTTLAIGGITKIYATTDTCAIQQDCATT